MARSDDERESLDPSVSPPTGRRTDSLAHSRRSELASVSPKADSDPESNARRVKKHDYGLPTFVRRESLSTDESHSRSRSRGSETTRHGAHYSPGLPREDSSSSYAASGFPGMSGIGLAPTAVSSYGSPPPIATTQANASSSGFHFPRFGSSSTAAGADSSAGSGFIGSSFRAVSRSRQSSQRERIPASFSSPRLGNESGSDGSYPSRGSKPGTSSGTSNSNNSAWNFFRSASSIHLPRHKHSDSFSSIQEAAESLHSPAISTPGIETPQVTKSGLTTPLGMPDLNEEINRRMNAASSFLKRDINKSASYTILETVPATSSSSLGSNKRRGKRSSNTSATTHHPTHQKADGLVAMAIKPEPPTRSSKVVVAGRSLLKVLSVTQGDEHAVEFGNEVVDEDIYSKSRVRSQVADEIVIKEELDVRAGLLNANGRNAKAAIINDVSWGYGLTANKIMTGNSNGTMGIYDIGQAGSKLERLMTSHLSGRGINVVSFGGAAPQGTLVASACQDGDINVSVGVYRGASIVATTKSLFKDFRHPSVITLSNPMDPVRSICFAPRENTTADAFHIMSASESGHIAQWDLRMPKHPLHRIMAHQGGAMTLDWKGAVSESVSETGSPDGDKSEKTGSNDSWGWLASAGMDGTVKIWDMSAHNHSPRLVHTLEASRPIQFIRWHASSDQPCDIVVTPMSVGPGIAQSDDHWQPNIEIWDVRRPYLPKQSIWTGGSTISCLSPTADTDVLWALNRSSSSFQQIDVEKEAIQPLDYVPKVATAWSFDGTLAFALKDRNSAKFVEAPTAVVKDSPNEASLPIKQTTGVVTGLDPSFDIEAFRYLASEYQTIAKGTVALLSACNDNAEAAYAAHRYSLATIWGFVVQWLTDEESDTLPSPAAAMTSSLVSTINSPDTRRKNALHHPVQGLRRTRSQTSPSTPLHHFQQREHSSKQSSPLVTSQILSESDISPRALPAKLPRGKSARRGQSNNADLVGSDTSNSSSVDGEAEAETNTASTTSSSSSDDESQQKGSGSIISNNPAMSMSALLSRKRPALTAMSRQNTNDHFVTVVPRSASGSVPTTEHSHTPRPSVPPTPAGRQMALPLSEIAASALARRASAIPGSSGMSRNDSSKTQTRFPSRKNSDESSISSDNDGKSEDGETTPEDLRARAQKKLSLNLRKVKARTGRSHTRRRVVSNNDAPTTRRGSKVASRSASAVGRRRVASSAGALAMQQNLELQAQEAKHALHGMMKEHLLNIMQELADEGDVQTSATMACLLREKLGVNPTFLARITAAYLSLLRQTDCHITSATLVKDSVLPAVREESQNNTTVRTACGNCERATHEPPFNKCRKCSATSTFCSICHTVGTALWIFCPTCGHGAHEECLYLYASELSLAPGGIEPLVDLDYFSKKSFLRGALTPTTTAPSSPLVLYPAEQALFHTTSAIHSRLHSRAVSPEPLNSEALETRTMLLSQCPSGCGHSCLLTLPLSELAAATAERQHMHD